LSIRRSLSIALLAGLCAAAQQDYRLRVTVQLVQVDATVTDVHGDFPPDLTAADFRVLLDGKPQEIKYCNYVRLKETDASSAAHQPPATAAHPAMPTLPVRRGDVRRTIVLYVADLLTSQESIPAIRSGLKDFVQRQMLPGDLVAIVRSSAGLGALQDFTADQSRLLQAVDHVKWSNSALGIGGASAYDQIGLPAITGDLAQLDKIDSVERATLATTASLLQVIGGMAALPGRKSLVLLSDGLRLSNPDELDPTGNKENGTGAFLGPIYASMRRVADESVRAGVVVYAIDTRGTTSLRAMAADRLKPPDTPTGDWIGRQTEARRADYRDNQWGSIFLSAQTGGFLITEANQIDRALERVMKEQRGYYLLGFQPPEEALRRNGKDDVAFHRLKIELLRPGFTVRSHAGFFGVADDELAAAAPPRLQILDSVESPPASQLDVEAGYLAAKHGYLLRTTLYIDGNSLQFRGPPNHRTCVLHLVVRAFDAKGDVLPGGIDQFLRVDLDSEGFDRTLRYGLIYSALLPAAKTGAYQVRAALRDEGSGKLASGGDFVSIPAPSRSGLQLSSIIFQHDLGTEDHIFPASGPHVYASGQSVRFAFQISSAAGAKAEGLELRTRLFRDGAQVWESDSTPLQSDAVKTSNPMARGSLTVPAGLVPGEYLVRVDVAEKANPAEATAWQWARLKLR
jgi:VWFA-related protein